LQHMPRRSLHHHAAPLPAATWDAEVKKMIQTFGMTNPEGVASQITKYLQEHYTPEKRKH